MSNPRSFAKLARSVPAAASPNPNNTPTIGELRHRQALVKREADALKAERDKLALASLSGDAKAVSAIASIDAERAKLAAQDETLHAAITALSPAKVAATVSAEQPDIPKQVNAGRHGTGTAA